MYKYVIFDLDGTLLNTLDDLANAGNYALEKMGFPVHETEKYMYFVGNGIPKLIERILPQNVTDEIKQQTYEIFCSYYQIHMNDFTAPYDGVISMLEQLKQGGKRIAVVTNKADTFAKEIVKRYFGELVDAVYGSVEGFPKKPDPYWVNKAVLDFDADKNEVFYVGDSGVDMQTAVNAGVTPCGVLWGFRQKEELVQNGAAVICSNCSEIIRRVYNFLV